MGWVGGGGGGGPQCRGGGGPQCRMTILRICNVTWVCRIFSPMSYVKFDKSLCLIPLHFHSTCHLSLSPLSHVDFNKCPCRPVVFRGQGPGGVTWYQPVCVCQKVKDMSPFSASSIIIKNGYELCRGSFQYMFSNSRSHSKWVYFQIPNTHIRAFVYWSRPRGGGGLGLENGTDCGPSASELWLS